MVVSGCATPRNTAMATPQAAPMPTTAGQWASLRMSDRSRNASTVATTQPASGSTGTSHRMLDMRRLLRPMRGLGTGRRQVRPGRRGRCGRQRLLILDRLLVGLAQLLPDADVERVLTA